MKKFLSMLLSVLLLAAALPLSAVSADTYGDLTYAVSGGKVTITGCDTNVTGVVNIPASINGYPVTKIANSAFAGCAYMIAVTIPEGITVIEGYTFAFCASLNDVTLPVSVTNIDAQAFYQCISICNVYYAGTAAQHDAILIMADNDSLNNATWHYGSAGGSGGSGGSDTPVVPFSLNYAVADGYATITGYNGNAPAYLEIPATIGGYPVLAIGERAFEDCDTLTSVVIPEGVTTIAAYTFYGCEALTTVTIPESLTTVEHAFNMCTALTDVYYPGDVLDRSYINFSTTGTNYLRNATWHYDTTDVTGECVWTLDGTHLTISGNGAMADYSGISPWGDKITSVTIEEGVTNIGAYAFEGCTALVSVEISNSVTSIGGYAFYDCDALTSVVIPEGVTTIADYTFSDCDALTTVTIPESLTTVEHAFNMCTALADVYYPGDVLDRSYINFSTTGTNYLRNATWHYDTTDVTGDCIWTLDGTHLIISGNGAMADYSGISPWGDKITSVTIEEGVTNIGAYAFEGCTALVSVEISNSVTSIGGYAFYNCEALTSVVIPEGVTTIAAYTFSGCDALTTVTIPESLTTVEHAFSSCTALTDVYYPGDVLDRSYINFSTTGTNCLEDATWHYDTTDVTGECVWTLDGTHLTISGNGAMADYSGISPWGDKITSVTIEEGVTNIGAYAFYGCKALASVAISDSVTSIGGYAFYNCEALTSVVIPEGVTTIAAYTFSGCEALTTVTIPESLTTVEYAFNMCTALADVYYPGDVLDRSYINFNETGTSYLENATWHYAADPISDTVTHSVMDTDNGNGLAFYFELSAQGVAIGSDGVADLTNATINYLGQTCKLVGAGAVISNQEDATLELGNINGHTMIDIPMIYLQEVGEDSCAFATRIIDIPESALERTIYARAYYITEVNGEQIVVYGDIDSASCAEYM